MLGVGASIRRSERRQCDAFAALAWTPQRRTLGRPATGLRLLEGTQRWKEKKEKAIDARKLSLLIFMFDSVSRDISPRGIPAPGPSRHVTSRCPGHRQSHSVHAAHRQTLSHWVGWRAVGRMVKGEERSGWERDFETIPPPRHLRRPTGRTRLQLCNVAAGLLASRDDCRACLGTPVTAAAGPETLARLPYRASMGPIRAFTRFGPDQLRSQFCFIFTHLPNRDPMDRAMLVSRQKINPLFPFVSL